MMHLIVADMCLLPMRYSRYSGTAGTAAVQQRYSRYSSGTADTRRFGVPCTRYSRYTRYTRYSGTPRYSRYSRPPGLRRFTAQAATSAGLGTGVHVRRKRLQCPDPVSRPALKSPVPGQSRPSAGTLVPSPGPVLAFGRGFSPSPGQSRPNPRRILGETSQKLAKMVCFVM